MIDIQNCNTKPHKAKNHTDTPKISLVLDVFFTTYKSIGVTTIRHQIERLANAIFQTITSLLNLNDFVPFNLRIFPNMIYLPLSYGNGLQCFIH